MHHSVSTQGSKVGQFRGVLVFVVLFKAIFAGPSPVFCQDKDSEFKLGVIASLSGIAQEDGKTIVQAAKLAAEDINSKDGTKIALVIEDDGTVSKNSITAFQKLEHLNVDAILGATWDFTTNPLMPLTARYKKVLISSSTLPESLNFNESGGYAFANGMSVFQEAKPFERWVRSKHLKKIVVIYANNNWGETQFKAYKEIAEKQALKIQAAYPSAGYDDNDWRLLIPKIKAASPDGIVLLLNKSDIEIFLRRASELNLGSLIFGSKNTFDAVLSTKSKQLYENICFTYPYEQMEGHVEFSKRYKAAYGEVPRIYADNAYDAVFILHAASMQAKDEGLTLERILKTREFSGLVGMYKYAESSSLGSGKASLVCLKDGEFKY